jgi:hypothetical protein
VALAEPDGCELPAGALPAVPTLTGNVNLNVGSSNVTW